MLALKLNALPESQAKKLLLTCCGSRHWVAKMMSGFPFRNKKEINQCARNSWVQLSKKDWLEAYSWHPEIGDINSLRKKFSSTKHLAGKEQSGVKTANKTTLTRLAGLNRDYKNKFGFIFIICATGKTAEQMLKALEKRIEHDFETELHIAAKEQLKITLLRLSKISWRSCYETNRT